ncbi:unnamed protein product [Sphenostylis stenocarpa]|uniref:Uncharacterized protein n=1 Tax=Sphenostylis stenocarpa TaxID=92480 RepID=A0AA86SIM8_9FABA|nr:unnamed protein product [Sphenostylis stenocarpa]
MLLSECILLSAMSICSSSMELTAKYCWAQLQLFLPISISRALQPSATLKDVIVVVMGGFFGGKFVAGNHSSSMTEITMFKCVCVVGHLAFAPCIKVSDSDEDAIGSPGILTMVPSFLIGEVVFWDASCLYK